MKGHSDVVQDDTENEMFKDLLGDYAAPAEDAGFSDIVMASLPGEKKSKHFKSLCKHYKSLCEHYKSLCEHFKYLYDHFNSLSEHYELFGLSFHRFIQ